MFDRMQYIIDPPVYPSARVGSMTIRGIEGDILGYIKWGIMSSGFRFEDTLGSILGEAKMKWMRGLLLTDSMGVLQGKIGINMNVRVAREYFIPPIVLTSPSGQTMLTSSKFNYIQSFVPSYTNKMNGMIDSGALIFSANKSTVAGFKRPVSSIGLQIDIVSKDFNQFFILSLVAAMLLTNS